MTVWITDRIILTTIKRTQLMAVVITDTGQKTLRVNRPRVMKICDGNEHKLFDHCCQLVAYDTILFYYSLMVWSMCWKLAKWTWQCFAFVWFTSEQVIKNKYSSESVADPWFPDVDAPTLRGWGHVQKLSNQGSHSTWKTWKTWKNESTPGKPGNIMEFCKI